MKRKNLRMVKEHYERLVQTDTFGKRVANDVNAQRAVGEYMHDPPDLVSEEEEDSDYFEPSPGLRPLPEPTGKLTEPPAPQHDLLLSPIHIPYTISEDRCGDQEHVMSTRLAALSERSEEFGRMKRDDHHNNSQLRYAEILQTSKHLKLTADSDERPPEFALFVSNLSVEANEFALLSIFKRHYSSCTFAKLVLDPLSGKSRGCGFVLCSDEFERETAFVEMQGILWGDRPMRHARSEEIDEEAALFSKGEPYGSDRWMRFACS